MSSPALSLDSSEDRAANPTSSRSSGLPAALRPGAIILIRHGEPALSRKCLITAREYGDWWAKYEIGGLLAGQTPPPELVAAAQGAGAIYASTRQRAQETAAAVAAGKEDDDRRHVHRGAPAAAPDPRLVQAVAEMVGRRVAHSGGTPSITTAARRLAPRPRSAPIRRPQKLIAQGSESGQRRAGLRPRLFQPYGRPSR
jgi:hypothetical protein